MTYTDLNYLNDFTGGDHDLVKEAVKRYLKRSPELLAELNESYKNGDWEKVAFVAHSLYSSTQIVGIVTIKEPLRDIQKIANENHQDKEKLSLYIKDINEAIEASYEELRIYK